jgi:parvulin-like peptidyl-prolyl isomerase
MRRFAFACLLAGCAAVLISCRNQTVEPEAADGDHAVAQTSATSGEAAASQDAGAAAPVSATQGVGDFVARVNGVGIALAEFQRQVFAAQHFYVDQGLDPNSDEGQKQLLSVRRQVLRDMIDQALIEKKAPELGVTVADEEIAQRMAQFVEKVGGQEAFEQSLTTTGTTREEIEAMERSAVIGAKVYEKVTGDVGTTGVEAVHVRHILCDTAEDCDKARARLLAGEDFAAVALVSRDDTSKDRGGDLDWILRGTHWSQSFEDAIFAQQVGQVSDVIATEYGFHVIEVLERASDRKLTDVQINDLRAKKLMDWLAQQRAESAIDIYVDDLADVLAP